MSTSPIDSPPVSLEPPTIGQQPSNPRSSRREFLAQTLATTIITHVPRESLAKAPRVEPIAFGLCADVHQDVMHDGSERIAAFVATMNQREVDFITQLGDFCVPKTENRGFVETFHGFAGPAYHVLGNHDTDADNLTKHGFRQEETRRFWGMEHNHYSFVQNGIRFVVLDGNNQNPEADPSQYPRHVGADQRSWLAKLLSSTEEPLVLFSHQSLENAEGLDNAPMLRTMLEQANEQAGRHRVLACFSGHHHLNHMVKIHGITYVQINSMSYFWVGEECENFSYPRHIHDSSPMMQFTAPYRDPIWSIVTIDPAASEIRIEGRTTSWAGKPPDELGYRAPASRRQGMEPRTSSWTFNT